METRTNKQGLHRLTSVTLMCLLCLCIGAGVSQADSTTLTTTEANRMAEINLAGLHGERTRVPEMLQDLNIDNPSGLTLGFRTPMIALARLGAVEALPAFDAILRKDPTGAGVYTRVYRARLVAEAAQGRSPLPQSQPAETEQTQKPEAVVRKSLALPKMRALLAELNMNADSIRRDLVAYEQNQDRSIPERFPVAQYALDQIADIAYQEGYTPDKDADDINSLDFSEVPGAALKMRLASLPRPQRIVWLIDDLTIHHKNPRLYNFEKQLLLDEGPGIGSLLATRYTEITTHPDKYDGGKAARGMLISVLELLGDNRQAPLFLEYHRQVQRANKQPVFTPKTEDRLAQLDQHKRLVVAGY